MILGFRLLPKKTEETVIVNNTFVGGVGGYITSASLLSNRLSITSANITNFQNDGVNISAYIDANYSINASTFINDYTITYWKDYGNRCIAVNDRSFRSGTNGLGLLTHVHIPACINAYNTYLFYRRDTFKEIVMSRTTAMGLTNGGTHDNQFGGLTNWGSCKLWVPVSLQTANGGAVEGDVAYFISRGGTVVYVTNYTAPSAITGLTVSSVYENSVQLSWEVPANTNGIMKYQIRVNHQITTIETINNTIRIAGLTNGTVYRFEVMSVDTFYNFSPLSNPAYSLVNGAHPDWASSFIAYYNFDGDVLDSANSNDGTAYNVTYESGIAGQSLVLNDTTSYVNLNSTSLIGGKNAFSVACVFKMNTANDNNILYGSWVTTPSILIRVHTGALQFYTHTGVQVGGTFTGFTDTTTFHHLVCTYDGDKMKMYLDSVLLGTTYNQTGVINNGVETEAWGRGQATNFGNFSLDGGALFDYALNQSDVTTIHNLQMGGYELI